MNFSAQEGLPETGVGVGGDGEPSVDSKDWSVQGSLVIHSCICSDHHRMQYCRAGEQGEGKQEKERLTDGQ